MKNTFFLFFLLNITISNLNAQTQKGNWLVNGSFFTSILDLGSENLISASLQTQFGRFISEDFAVGSGLHFVYTRTSFSRNSAFGVSPFGRYYLLKGKWKPFVQLGFHVSREDIKIKDQTIPFFPEGLYEPNTNFKFTIGTGLNYFFSSNAAFEAKLNFHAINTMSNKNFATVSQDDIVLDLGMNFFINNQDGSQESLDLIDRYLKKGNRFIEIGGNLDFDGLFRGYLEFNKFYKHRGVLNSRLNLVVGDLFNEDDFGYLLNLVEEFQNYFPISNTFQFSPTYGISVLTVGREDNSDTGVNAFVGPGFSAFAKKAVFDLHVQIYTPFLVFGDGSDDQWVGDLTIGAEVYINKNLAVQGSYHYNLFGRDNISSLLYFYFAEPFPGYGVSAGFTYFIEKD